MIFFQPLPNLAAAMVLYLIVTIIFQGYSIETALSVPLGHMHYTCIALQSKLPFQYQ